MLVTAVWPKMNLAEQQYAQQLIAFSKFVPQVIFSLIMFRLAFIAQKQTYDKVAYATDLVAPSATTPEGVIAIRGVSTATRCDICHQADKFDATTGYCSRCQLHTC
ncbi:MAG: hypothetical protein AB1489_18680, partial [Acidobacteriota bacterium]